MQEWERNVWSHLDALEQIIINYPAGIDTPDLPADLAEAAARERRYRALGFPAMNRDQLTVAARLLSGSTIRTAEPRSRSA